MEVKKIDLNESSSTDQGATDTNNTVSANAVKSSKTSSNSYSKVRVISIALAILVGTLSGFFVAKQRMPKQSEEKTATTQLPTSKEEIKVGDVFGSSDKETFKDSAVGVLRKGGIDGEGSHHLVRPGGPSKNVYITSSFVDLDMFEGHKVKVWGQTFNAKKAGWFMDVGIVEVLELNASSDSTE